MADDDLLIARAQADRLSFAGVGLVIPDPATVGPRDQFWAWPDCAIEKKPFSDPSNPTLILAARPGAADASWSPGLGALVITDPLWLFVDSAKPIDDAAAMTMLQSLESWPAGVTPAFGEIPENGAVRAVGTLSLAGWPALASLARTLGLDAKQRVFVAIDFPAGFPRVVVRAHRDSIAGLIQHATLELASVLGPSTQRVQASIAGTIPLGTYGAITLSATVPLDGGRIVGRGEFTGPGSTLTKILPLYRGGDVTLAAGVELIVANGTLALDLLRLQAAVTGVDLVRGLITVDAEAAITIVDPLGARLATTTLAGRATFGRSGVAMDLRGSYPSGQFQLSLVPGAAFDLAALLEICKVPNLPRFLVTSASVSYLAGPQFLAVQASADCAWTIGPLHIDAVDFAVQGKPGAYAVAFGTRARLVPTSASTPSRPVIDFVVNARYETLHDDVKGWTLAGRALTSATVAELLRALGIESSLVPDALTSVALTDLSVLFSDDPTASRGAFSCVMALGGAELTLVLDVSKTAKGWQLTNASASVAAAPGETGLNVGTVAGAIGLHPPAAILGVLGEIEVVSTRVAFRQSAALGKTLSLALTGAVSGKTVSIALVRRTSLDGTTSSSALAAIDLSIGLADLPVIGGTLAQFADLGISHVDIIAGSAGGSSKDVVQFLLDEIGAAGGVPPAFPAANISSSVALSLQMHLGATALEPLWFAGEEQPQQEPAKPALRAAAAGDRAAGTGAAGTDTATPGASGKWINVEKSFGPINVRRIGLDFADGDILLMLEAGFLIAAVNLELEGLALRFTPTLPPQLKAPALRGIALSFDNGTMRLAGGLVAVNRGGQTQYDGQLMLTAASFQLTAIGSYTSGPQGASLFGFALLDKELGGPPFFFVTGVAAGFGFNRTLRMPTIDTVEDFALVRAVQGDARFAGGGLTGALAAMQRDVPVAYGENWLALGVKFTTFRLLDSVALITARFGADVEIGILGTSTMTIPTNTGSQASGKKTPPIGYARLALQASFKPADGVLSMTGQLTRDSYILSPDCHLTGGFAYKAWFKSQGPDLAQAGDFVVTLGGYHPSFKRPEWYPVVPRVGAIWQVTPNLLVKSSLYFALTPSTVMAGGALEATWQSGDLRAWFTLEAHFLLCWKPFYYEARVAVSLGASYRVNLWLTSFTVTVQVGVDLRFWGPPFAGTATVDLYVVRFTISFGDSSAARKKIDWANFKKSFLPEVREAPPAPVDKGLLAAPPAPPPDSPYCSTRVSGGLLKDLTAGPDPRISTDPHWVIDPERFALVTNSVIPITRATVDALGSTSSFAGTAVDVGPVGIAAGDLRSEHTITLSRIDGVAVTPGRVAFEVTTILANVPRATWSTSTALEPGLGNANATPVITNVLTGVALRPVPRTAKKTVAITRDALQFTARPKVLPLALGQRRAPTALPPQQNAAARFKDSLLAAADIRDGIVKELNAQGLAVAIDIDVQQLHDLGHMVLLSAPVLSPLGAEPDAT